VTARPRWYRHRPEHPAPAAVLQVRPPAAPLWPTQRRSSTMRHGAARCSPDGRAGVNMHSASAGHHTCQAARMRWLEPAASPVDTVPVHLNALGDTAMTQAPPPARSSGQARGRLSPTSR